MNILFVSAVFPYPLYSGGQIRIYNLLKELAKNNSIYLCCFIRDEKENALKKNLSFCREIHTVYRGRAWQPKYILRSIFGKYPFLMNTYDNSQMRELVTTMVSEKKIDIVHVEPGYVSPSLPDISIPLVVAEHNIEHAVYTDYVDRFRYPIIRQLLRIDVKKIKEWEKFIWKKASRVIAVSKEDAEYISKNVESVPVSIVTNGVDDDMFLYKPKSTISEDFTCLFVGNFRWMQNVDAVKHLLSTIWPKITATYPKALLRIVGREFPVGLLSSLPTSVRLIDHVENITDEFNRCDILLAPIRVGGGTKYKILEAMASGISVITTQKGIEGLDIEDDKHCYICKNDDDWTNKISKILGDNKLNNKIVQNARFFIESSYTWKHISIELEHAWRKAYETRNS